MNEKLFDLIGLGVPFYLGAATYGVFVWLDSIASDEATKVISSWLHGRSKHKPDLGNVIINAFDRVYTSPILSFRAFRRSAAISSIIWLLLYFVPWTGRLYTSRQYDPAPFVFAYDTSRSYSQSMQYIAGGLRFTIIRA
jgi:hypothetical protein